MPRTSRTRHSPEATTPTYISRHTGPGSPEPPVIERRSPQPVIRCPDRRRSSEESTGSYMSVASTPGYRLRPVSLSDEALVALAHESKRKINWDAILRAQDVGPSKWIWREYNGDFSIFVREDPNKFAVLAIGAVPGSVAEIVSVMHARDNKQYLRKMEALYGDDFRDGCFVYNVDLESEHELSRHTTDPDDDSQLVGLSVKTATFRKPSWLAKHEEWCYLDAVYQVPATDGSPLNGTKDSFEKLMTSIRPQDIIAGLSAGHTKYIESVISGYLLKPEIDPQEGADPCRPKSTRVHFYTELSKTVNQHHFGGLYMPSFGTTATDKAVKNRLLKMARSSARLPLIVRRRRLGVQNVIDPRKIFPPTSTRCVGCDKFLLLAKLCRLCGQGVCQSCSSKHYRETLDHGTHRIHIEHIRVCDACITRVERSNYSYLTHTSLAAPRIRRDPEGSKRASEVLRDLLKDAYQSAESEEKRKSVLTVMKNVLEQSNSPSHALVTEGITTGSLKAVLEDIHINPVEPDEAELAHTEGRSYALDPRDATEPMHHPLPPNEDQRLQAIEEEHLRQLSNIPELNIICELAAEELGCFATMVTVIDRDDQLILGANLPFLREAQFPRDDTFCSHIIMDNKPLVVPHPEADIRFGQCGPVQNFGARYYCGFPVLAHDGTVLGSLCCVDTKTQELTASQYATLKQLAQTATKIVQTATQRFDRDQLREQLLQATRTSGPRRKASQASSPERALSY